MDSDSIERSIDDDDVEAFATLMKKYDDVDDKFPMFQLHNGIYQLSDFVFYHIFYAKSLKIIKYIFDEHVDKIYLTESTWRWIRFSNDNMNNDQRLVDKILAMRIEHSLKLFSFRELDGIIFDGNLSYLKHLYDTGFDFTSISCEILVDIINEASNTADATEASDTTEATEYPVPISLIPLLEYGVSPNNLIRYESELSNVKLEYEQMPDQEVSFPLNAAITRYNDTGYKVYIDIATILLQYGADPNLDDLMFRRNRKKNKYKTALGISEYDVIDNLVIIAMRLNDSHPLELFNSIMLTKTEITPFMNNLMVASFYGYHVAVKKYLSTIANKTEINTQDDRGNTALHYAIWKSKSHHTVQYLLDAGADPFIQNNSSITPFDLLTNLPNPEKIITTILSKNPSTILHYTPRDIISLLLPYL